MKNVWEIRDYALKTETLYTNAESKWDKIITEGKVRVFKRRGKLQ